MGEIKIEPEIANQENYCTKDKSAVYAEDHTGSAVAMFPVFFMLAYLREWVKAEDHEKTKQCRNQYPAIVELAEIKMMKRKDAHEISKPALEKRYNKQREKTILFQTDSRRCICFGNQAVNE